MAQSDTSEGEGLGLDKEGLAALRAALTILTDGQGDRAKRVLEQLSDPTTTPVDTPGPPATGAECRLLNVRVVGGSQPVRIV